jgi:YegS/Rv2252/BmrU family lipid kinase
MRKVALIHNPASGIRSTRHGAAIREALAVLRDTGVHAEALETHGPGTAVALAGQAVRDGFDSVIACGGDGTVNEVLQALVGTDVALGILPLGTANALAANLGLRGSPTDAARQLATAPRVRVPVGRIYSNDASGAFGSRYFTVAAGIGADALLLSRMDPALKRRLGYLLYIVEAFRVWATHSFPLFEASFTNGSGVPHVEEISQLLAVRVRNFGGVLRDFAPGATLHSHSLHLVAFNTRSRLDYFLFLTAVLFGRQTFSRHVHLIRADSVDCRPSNGFHHHISAETDGEVLGQIPVRIEIVPDAVSLLIPPTALP